MRNRFEASFCSGFEISGNTSNDDGYLVRRLSDGVELPATFHPEELRVADR